MLEALLPASNYEWPGTGAAKSKPALIQHKLQQAGLFKKQPS